MPQERQQRHGHRQQARIRERDRQHDREHGGADAVKLDQRDLVRQGPARRGRGETLQARHSTPKPR
jgi:hypothetical protein